MKVFDHNGNRIVDWREWTRPKKGTQWRAGRSAMELARAWFTSAHPVVPQEIAALLNTHARTRGAILREGWPELTTALPFRGEGRNHDLVLIGQVADEQLILTIEGKVDETMGPPVGAYWQKAKNSRSSKAWCRVDALLHAIFGKTAVATDPPWNALPYQMLTAIVGTAIEAHLRSCTVAAVCLHEIITESARPGLLKRNENDFNAFLTALGVVAPAAGQLYGPFDIAIPSSAAVVSVLVGKAQYRWWPL